MVSTAPVLPALSRAGSFFLSSRKPSRGGGERRGERQGGRVRPLACFFAALVLDVVLGDPPDRLHPTAWFGSVAARFESLAARRGGRVRAFAAGLVGAVMLPMVWAAALSGLASRRPRPLRLPAAVLLLKSTFAVRGLVQEAGKVGAALEAGDLELARRALPALVSRDVAGLSPADAASAAIESLAENVTDSFLGPWLYFALGGLPAALAYRAVNTLDSMWGYRDERYEWFGKAAARLDDVLNYPVATVAARLLALAGGLSGRQAQAGLEAGSAYGRATASPNAGKTIATMAGLLGVRLEKPGAYVLCEQARPPGPADVRTAQHIVALTAALGAGACCLALAVRPR
jgi:adenosylcobinamide-phosphate synthase